MTLESVVVEYGAMASFAVAVSLIIQILKNLKIVSDSTSSIWSVFLNIAGLAAFTSLKVFKPDIDLVQVDQNLLPLFQALKYILSFVLQLGVSKGTYTNVLKPIGVPVLSLSNSLEKKKAQALAVKGK